jgi:hypothetical protein
MKTRFYGIKKCVTILTLGRIVLLDPFKGLSYNGILPYPSAEA